jgi:hypothetical protein
MKLACLALVAVAACSSAAVSTKSPAPPAAPPAAVLAFLDPLTTPSQTAALCAGDSVELIVPMQADTDWQVEHAAVPANRRVVERWLGPGTPGLAFTFTFDAAHAKYAYEQIALVDKRANQRVTADLAIGCD